MIRADAIEKIAPAAKPYAVELVKQMAEAGIMAKPMRAAMFLGQIHHESIGFTAVVEGLSYSEQRLREVCEQARPGSRWRSLLPRVKELARNPRGLAKAAYGGRMGNAPEPSDDGWDFRGRGLKQLTGRDNYRRFSRAWLGDESILLKPDRVADPDGAVASAVWFWVANGLNEIADRGNTEEVTLVVNGGLNGIVQRRVWTARYRNLWVVPDHSRLIGTVL